MNHNYKILFENKLYSISEFYSLLKNNSYFSNLKIEFCSNENSIKECECEIIGKNLLQIKIYILGKLLKYIFQVKENRLKFLYHDKHFYDIIRNNLFFSVFIDETRIVQSDKVGYFNNFNQIIPSDKFLYFRKQINKENIRFYRIDNIIFIEKEYDQFEIDSLNYKKFQESEKRNKISTSISFYLNQNVENDKLLFSFLEDKDNFFISSDYVPFWNPKNFHKKIPKDLYYHISYIYFLILKIQYLPKDICKKIFDILIGCVF